MALPISIKGIVFENDKVWLRKNERNEWELPGGKLDEGEQPKQTVTRELKEELGFKIKVIDIIQARVYLIEISSKESSSVLVISYLCEILEKTGNFEIEGEAGEAEFNKFSLKELGKLNMPNFYKEVIFKASEKK